MGGSTVQVRDRKAWPEGVCRQGYLARLVGALGDETRLARLIVVVPDPLAQETAHQGKPPLLVNAFMEVEIEGEPIPDVVRLDRKYLREDNTVWVMEGNRLHIRQVEVLLQDATYAYLRQGLQSGDSVVTTNLSTVADSAKLKLK